MHDNLVSKRFSNSSSVQSLSGGLRFSVFSTRLNSLDARCSIKSTSDAAQTANWPAEQFPGANNHVGVTVMVGTDVEPP